MPPDEIIIDVTKKSYRPLVVKVVLFIGILCLLGITTLYFPVSTRVSMEVPVNQVEWTLGLFPTQQILNPLLVETISFQKFASVDFNPTSLDVADPEDQKVSASNASPMIWSQVTVFGDVRFSPIDQDSLVQFHPVDSMGQSLGTLGAIQVREESNVILERVKGEPRTIRISIFGPESTVQFTPLRPFSLHSQNTEYSGLKEFPLIHKSSLVFRPDLPEHRSSFEIKGTKQQLIITVKISPSEQPYVLSEKAIPIKAIDFSRKDTSGLPESALAGPVRITYTDFPERPDKMIPITEVVQIVPSQILTIQRITYFDDTPRLLISVEGLAESIQSGSGDFSVDHRILLMDHFQALFPLGGN